MPRKTSVRWAAVWGLFAAVVPAARTTAADTGPAVAPLYPAATAPAAPAGSANLLPVGGFGGNRSRVAPLYPCLPCPTPGYLPPFAPGSPGTPGMPGTPGSPADPMNPANPMNPTTPPDPTNPLAQAQNPFAQGTEAGGEGAVAYNQTFFGDFAGVFVTRTVVDTVPPTVSGGQRVVIVNGVRTLQPPTVTGGTAARTLRIPVGSRYNGVQIVDNDQPRPVDRVYFGYNYYDQAGAALNGGSGYDLNRETIGFEKTFLDGSASFGMRLPFVQTHGPSVDARQVGDLSLLFKYALFENRKTGDLVSAGLVVTTPTGSSSPGVTGLVLGDQDLPHSWLLQPWAGFVKVYDRVYFQGISNLIVPTDGRDVTLWGNSLSAGYWLYRNPDSRYLTGIVPVAEVHVRTPLNHRSPSDEIFVQDQVNVNAGTHFRMKRAVLSGAVSVPTVGPRAWNVEAIGYLNYLF